MNIKQEPINICMCGNDKMVYGTLLTLLSVAKTTDRPLHVYFLTANINTGKNQFNSFRIEDGKYIESILKRYNNCSVFDVVDCKDVFLDEFADSTNMKSGYTPYAFMRLIVDELPINANKLLYLDTDLIICKNIAELYDIELSDYDVAMAMDQQACKWFGKKYCNSGVLLINLRRIRLNCCFSNVRHVVNHRKMFMPDQTALNIVCKNSRIKLNNKFNEQLELNDKTVVRHYCKRFYVFPYIHTVNIKPWDIASMRNKFGDEIHKELFDEYLGYANKINLNN